jgi:hypothetical protein
VPRTRVEYLSPAPIFWIHDGIRYGGQAFIDFLGPSRDYQPGERTDEWWFGAPLHAMGYGDRGADWMFVGVADLRDTGGHNGYPWEWSEEPVATQAFRLYRNGRLLASAAREPFLQVAVPATRASYRVERDLNLRGLTRLANVSRTRWWFISAAPAGQDPYALLPLLAVDYQAAPLGGRNGAVAGRPVTIDLRVARQEGAPASEVAATRLWSSTDDGATWREVGRKRTGAGHYRAVLQGSSLRSGTYVSLRTWARDATNSRIDQTLVRAFPVR